MNFILYLDNWIKSPESWVTAQNRRAAQNAKIPKLNLLLQKILSGVLFGVEFEFYISFRHTRLFLKLSGILINHTRLFLKLSDVFIKHKTSCSNKKDVTLSYRAIADYAERVLMLNQFHSR